MEMYCWLDWKGREMQEKHEIWHNAGDDMPLRTGRLVEYLGTLTKRDYEPSADALKDIAHFVLDLADPYKTMGLRALAVHFVNSMGLHYLQLMVAFQENAEKEGIEQETMTGTFDDIMPQWFQKMVELDFVLSVESVDDLIKLVNITIGLFRPSQLTSAENTQRWLYSLPEIYYAQLEKEQLVKVAHS
jgi:hypothetical protein